MKHQCPNCGQYKFEKTMGTKGCALVLVFVVPIFTLMIPGASSFYGGNLSLDNFSFIIAPSIILGLLLLLYNIWFPSKTISYRCSNCSFEKEFNNWFILNLFYKPIG